MASKKPAKRDFLSVTDFTPEETWSLIQRARDAKSLPAGQGDGAKQDIDPARSLARRCAPIELAGRAGFRVFSSLRFGHGTSSSRRRGRVASAFNGGEIRGPSPSSRIEEANYLSPLTRHRSISGIEMQRCPSSFGETDKNFLARARYC